MPNYRRLYYPGGMYFLTVNLQDRSRKLLVDQIETLRESFKRVKLRHPFDLTAVVVLPDHMHLIMALPPGDTEYSTRVRLIKSGFSRELPCSEPISLSRKKHGERGIWQRRFYEHLIRDERDLESHVNYIHFNPVKHGYVDSPLDWPFSSMHRFVKNGYQAIDWENDWVGCDLDLR